MTEGTRPVGTSSPWGGRKPFRFGRVMGALTLAVMLSATGCDALDTSVSGGAGGGEPLPEPIAADELPPLEKGSPSAGSGEGEVREIVSGEAGGGWRLFGMPSPMGEFLCFEAEVGSAQACLTAFESGPLESQSESGAETEATGDEPGWPESWAVLGMPTLAEGEPPFVFGTLEVDVSRVMVELESGDSVEAEIVGEERAHYVASLPLGASPSEVVVFGPSGEELARRGFMPDEAGEDSWVDSWEQSCEGTDDGSVRCAGSASGGGYVSGSGGVDDE